MILKPLDTLKNVKTFYTLDVETFSLNATQKNLWFGCIYGQNYKSTFTNQDGFFKIIKGKRFKNTIIYAHNGGRFDYLVLFGNLVNFDTVFSGSRFIYLKYGSTVFADSLNFFKTSLSNIGDMLGTKKTQLENIGHIKKGTIPSKTDIDYCFNDCEILYHALENIFENNRPALTIGGLSLQVYRRKYLHQHLKFNPAVETKYLKAYYGGRTEAFKLGKVLCDVYDINSMYPFVMSRLRLPHPSFSFALIRPTLKEASRFVSHAEGLIYCQVEIPGHLKYAPLPYRYEGKTVFPKGKFSGAWCMNEMRNALEHGAEIKKVFSIYSSSRVLYGAELFGNFVQDFYNLKNTSDGIMQLYYKLVLNNLYGKFGQHDFTESKYFETKEDAIAFLKGRNDFHLWQLKLLSSKRADCYLEKNSFKNTSHSIISFAAYITAQARIELFKYMLRYNPLYVDTDSLFVPPSTKVKISSRIGLLKKEPYQVTKIIGLKHYIKKHSGVESEKIKGVPKKAVEIFPGTWQYTNLIGSKAAIRRNMEAGTPVQVTKVLKNIYTKGTVTGNLISPFVFKK